MVDDPDSRSDETPVVYWERMPASVSAWREAQLFDGDSLPQPTSSDWLISEARPADVLAVLHIGVASCLAARCHEGPTWMDTYGGVAGESVRRFVLAGDEDELAAAHEDLDAVLKAYGHRMLQSDMADRRDEVRREAQRRANGD